MREPLASSPVRQARRTRPGAPAARSATRFAAAGVLALLSAVAVPVLAPSAALADHESTYVICPDPVLEGNSAQMGVRRSGFDVHTVTAFTDHGDGTAGPDDYTEYHGVRFEQSGGATLQVPIETAEDTQPEHDETFAIGIWGDGVWHGCVVTIVDDDAPRITGVDFSSSPAGGWAYRAGDAIDVVVSLDQNVEVEGTPILSLHVGDSRGSTWRGATYRSGSSTRELVFGYRVQPEDLDLDGLSVPAAATAEDRTPAYGFSGTINAAGTDVPIDYAHPGITTAQRQMVDGRPYVKSTRIISSPEAGMDTYRANEVIEFAFTFNTHVVVDGDACVEFLLGYATSSWGAASRQADYLRGSGTDTLTFGYTVQPGDTDSRGVILVIGTEESGFCGRGTIKAEGTDVERSPSYSSTWHQSGHMVDTTPPETSSVAITSQPADGEAYTAGETITVEVAFNEAVAAVGTPYVELHVGEETIRAELVADQGLNSSLVFEYVVRSGDADSDGAGIGANSVRHNDGDIHDRAGNLADLSHRAVVADSGQRVDAAADC